MARGPLSLAQQVQMHAERIAAIDHRISHLSTVERPAALDVLRQLEQRAIGKAPGWEDVTLSGYIPEHAPTPVPVPPAVDDEPKKKPGKKPVDEE